MSDIMFDDIEYNLKDYVVHDDNNIKGFFGKYRWLSNFHLCPIIYEDSLYPSTENAYQAGKIVPEERDFFITCSPYDSKKYWPKFKRLDASDTEWQSRKLDVMKIVLIDKFNRNKYLADLLIATGDKYLEETNHWFDDFYGYDYKNKRGENHLGKMLMEIRSNLLASHP